MTVSEMQIEAAKNAVRDEYGSQLCWNVDGKRRCRTERSLHCMCREIAESALTAALCAQAGGWQDISTAPKDGTPVLLSGVMGGRRWMMDGTIYARGWVGGSSVGSDPDCWQPLPAPPPSSTAGEDKS